MGSTLAKPSLRPPFRLLAGGISTTSRPPSLSLSSLSIPSPPPFLADYLVDRLGYPKDQALAASKPLLHITSPEKPDAVLDFLRRRAGLSIPQLRRFVRCRPSILTADVPSNLLPKLSLFHSLLSDVGASPDDTPSKDLAVLVSACAAAFGYSTARLAPALDLLRSLFAGDNRKVASALRCCPRLLTNDPNKSIGVVPDELEHLELPSFVEVMRERVDFLHRLGLSVDDFNSYPLILACSVRKNMIPVLSYLEKLGIRRPRLADFLCRYPQVLHASIIVELVPVVKFLRGLDVDRSDD